jgi:hypothetical protein
VIWRPGQLGIPREPRYGWPWQGVWENDGGDDAPLSPRGRLIFRSVLVAIVVLGGLLFAVSARWI